MKPGFLGKHEELFPFDGSPDYFTRAVEAYDAHRRDVAQPQPFLLWEDVGRGLADIERRLRKLEERTP